MHPFLLTYEKGKKASSICSKWYSASFFIMEMMSKRTSKSKLCVLI